MCQGHGGRVIPVAAARRQYWEEILWLPVPMGTLLMSGFPSPTTTPECVSS